MAGRIQARAVREGDVEYLVAHLREADRQEIAASHGPDLLASVFDAVNRSSHVYVAEKNDRLVTLWGYQPLSMLSGVGCPWALGTPEMDRNGKSILKLAQASNRLVRPIYPTLKNYVDVRNKRSIGWLQRLGFVIREPEPYGVLGLPFHPFEMV